MIYEEHLRAAEAGAWSLESIRWPEIDRATALAERDILSALHDAALIEGYLPVFAPRLMRLLWDDVDATAILSLEMYEGLKHYTALKRYLAATPGPNDPPLAAAHWRLGMIYELMVRKVDARAEYEAALKIDPKYAEAKSALSKLK